MAGARSRAVLVTGAARRLGAVIARRLAHHGHAVAIHYGRSDAAARALADELVEGGASAVIVQADLGDSVAVDDLIPYAARRLGRPIDALVNSASLFQYDAPDRFDPELLDRLMRVNLAAPLALTAALAAQSELQDAVVVNLLDQKVANLNPDFLSYTCTKLALDGATRMLAQAFAPRVRVNAVSPGLTLPSGDQSEEEFRAVASQNLLHRRVDPEAIADAVAFLIATDAVTGQNLFVDNGQRFVARDSDVMFETRRS